MDEMSILKLNNGNKESTYQFDWFHDDAFAQRYVENVLNIEKSCKASRVRHCHSIKRIANLRWPRETELWQICSDGE